MSNPPAELSADYFVHQARYFHRAATENLHDHTAALTNLLIAVDYLIELEEARRDRP